MSRTRNTVINMLTAFSGQAIALVISYIARIFFIRCLNSEYLGISGLFTNILSVLSLVELGVGPAMVYSLYKPLAERNTTQIKSLMCLYRKSYCLIGAAILILGTILTPLIPLFMQEIPQIDHLYVIFWLFVLNSSISYFFSYKRSLIIADQYRYIATIYRYAFYVLLNVCQIVILLMTHNYLLFLLLQIASTLLENIAVSIKADRMYPYLKEKTCAPLPSETVMTIRRNIGAMIFHKIGTIVVCSTDNLLISRLIGIVAVGIYSNYQLILNALNTVVGQITNAVVASVGNLGASEDKVHLESIFHCIHFGIYWIYVISTTTLMCMIQPFLSISFGAQLLFPESIVCVLLLNFYLSGMRKSVLVFRDALGLYWYDRYKPLAEAIINFIASIFLGIYFGTMGVFLGTTVSTLTTCFWVEPYVLYKYGFHSKLRRYFQQYGLYTCGMLIALAATWALCQFQQGIHPGALFLRLILCLIVPNLILFVLFGRTKEFHYFYTLVQKLLQSTRFHKKQRER